MPLFGTDTSSYQPLGTYDPGAYEIINVLDPTLPSKVDRNRRESRPWGVYSWIFPGEPGAYPVGRAINAIAKVGGGTPPLGVWFDYEDGQTSADQWQLVQAFQAADAQGVWSGYYSNDWRVDHQALLQSVGWRPYWMAAYPGPNDGVWRGYQASSVRDIQIWQWTSTNGQLDQNAVWDEPWYYKVIGGTPSPTPPQPEVDMGIVYKLAGNDGWVYHVFHDQQTGRFAKRLVVDGNDYASLQRSALVGEVKMKKTDSGDFIPFQLDPGDSLSQFPDWTAPQQGGGGGGAPAPISDADVQRIAEATADVQAARLKD